MTRRTFRAWKCRLGVHRRMGALLPRSPAGEDLTFEGVIYCRDCSRWDMTAEGWNLRQPLLENHLPPTSAVL